MPSSPKWRLAMLCAGALLASCKGPVFPKAPEPSTREALLVLPGFGYDRGAEKALRAVGVELASQGFDLYVPEYVRRSGLTESRVALLEFYRANRLDRYSRLHVFAFIAGAWTLNPVLASGDLSNVATVIYDRSPLQERAPIIAVQRLGLPARLLYGRVLFEVARTPYPPADRPGVRVGILVETKPTSFVRRFSGTARRLGAFDFRCEAMRQRHDDCAFVPMNHDQMYTRFAALVPDVLAFIRTGRFSEAADRQPPAGDPFARR